jgi:hypothetical protein
MPLLPTFSSTTTAGGDFSGGDCACSEEADCISLSSISTLGVLDVSFDWFFEPNSFRKFCPFTGGGRGWT